MIGAAENVILILALFLTISLEVSSIAKCDSDALFGSYLLTCILQQSKVKPTRTGPEGKETLAQNWKERLSRHLLRPQVQNQWCRWQRKRKLAQSLKNWVFRWKSSSGAHAGHLLTSQLNPRMIARDGTRNYFRSSGTSVTEGFNALHITKYITG